MLCKRLLAIGFAAVLSGVAIVWAQSSLGTAQSFAVLGGSTVTNTGPSVLTGNLGVSPGAAITGFPPGTVTGTIHAANAVALQAQNDVTTQYNALAGAACSADLTGQNLGGQTLTPGVYCFSSSAQLTGTLTLNAQGNANATFIFKTGSTLTTARRIVRCPDQRREPVRRGLADRQLRHTRNDHVIHRQPDRTDEHHLEHRREHHRRESAGEKRRRDAGHQQHLVRPVQRGWWTASRAHTCDVGGDCAHWSSGAGGFCDPAQADTWAGMTTIAPAMPRSRLQNFASVLPNSTIRVILGIHSRGSQAGNSTTTRKSLDSGTGI